MTSIEITAKGMNLTRQYVREILADQLPQLQNMIGQKLQKADGSKTAKFRNTVADFIKESIKGEGYFCSFQGFYYQCRASTNQVGIKASICINGGSYENNTYFCRYYDEWVEIGAVEPDGQTLASLYTLEALEQNRPSLWQEVSAADMLQKVEQWKQAHEAAEKLWSQIPPEVKESESLNLRR